MEYRPSLHLCVVPTEKGALMSPSTKVANLTLLIYARTYVFKKVKEETHTAAHK